MADVLQGHVVLVRLDLDGDETSALVPAGEVLVPIKDAADFDETGGLLTFDGGASVYAYEILDDGDETGTPMLQVNPPLATALAVDSAIYVWNTNPVGYTQEWVAQVVDDLDGGEPIEARISHPLIEKMGEAVMGLTGWSVVCERGDDAAWELTNVLGSKPSIDYDFVDDGTAPDLSAYETVTHAAATFETKTHAAATFAKKPASGGVTVAVGASSGSFAHGLGSTPARVAVTPLADPQQRWWVTTDSTDVTVTLAAAAAGTAVDFDVLAWVSAP